MSGFESIFVAVEQLRDGGHETANTRSEADILLSCVMSYTFLAYLAFWNPVLKEINDAQIFLQTRELGLDCCTTILAAIGADVGVLGSPRPPEVPPLGCSGWVLRRLRWSLGVPYIFLNS